MTAPSLNARFFSISSPLRKHRLEIIHIGSGTDETIINHRDKKHHRPIGKPFIVIDSPCLRVNVTPLVMNPYFEPP